MANETLHTAETEAVVGTAEQATLYDENNIPLVVDATHVDYFLQRGFKRARFEAKNVTDELLLCFDSARAAVSEFSAGVVSDGTYDPGDHAAFATAEVAMRELGRLWTELYIGLERTYRA